MASAPQRNAVRRLQRILDDEDYGPRLARLRGSDERAILERISRGEGLRDRALRDEIDAADARRRARERERRRRTLYQRAVDNSLLQHSVAGATRTGVERSLQFATDAELRFAENATRNELVVRARERPRDIEGIEINPFWYH